MAQLMQSTSNCKINSSHFLLGLGIHTNYIYSNLANENSTLNRVPQRHRFTVDRSTGNCWMYAAARFIFALGPLPPQVDDHSRSNHEFIPNRGPANCFVLTRRNCGLQYCDNYNRGSK